MLVMILNRLCCENKEINANICFNKRNGDTDRDEYFENYFIMRDIK